jgi:hypothetical protein|tara:strand:- start:56 stop:190 length:135 start_codon:yes stop_codon:yes gene_type:complete
VTSAPHAHWLSPATVVQGQIWTNDVGIANIATISHIMAVRAIRL